MLFYMKRVFHYHANSDKKAYLFIPENFIKCIHFLLYT